jgi:hypothetical protein
MAGLCSFDGDLPNDFSIRYKNDWTQALVFTWETGFGDAVDSASVDSIWTAWGYLDPQAYALAVPGEPAATLYANEPSGMTPHMTLAFQVLPEDSARDMTGIPNFAHVDLDTWNPEESSIGIVAPSPFGAGDSAYVAIFYPSLDPGTAPILMWLLYKMNAFEYNEGFWAFWFMVSENHQTTESSVNKLGFFQLGSPGGTDNSSLYFAVTGVNAEGSFNYVVFNQSTADGGNTYPCSGGRIIKAGQWHKAEHYVKLNTVTELDSANADGIWRVWIDGTLCVDTANVKFRGIEAAQVKADWVISRWRWNPTYTSPSSPPDTSYHIVTHFYQSGKKTD